MHTLKDLVDRNARLHAADLHQVFGERRTTFREFAHDAYRIADALVRSACASRTATRCSR